MDINTGLNWESNIIDSKINRNHGMTKTEIGGKEALCVSGVEGIFYFGILTGKQTNHIKQ